MGSPMQEAASANLKKSKKSGLLDPLLKVYKQVFPPVPPPAKQGMMTNRGARKQMEQIDKERF